MRPVSVAFLPGARSSPRAYFLTASRRRTIFGPVRVQLTTGTLRCYRVGMADVRKRRLKLIVVTGLIFVAISLAGALIGKALGRPPAAITAVTAPIAFAFVLATMGRIKKLK